MNLRTVRAKDQVQVITGWVNNVRDLGKVTFIELRSGNDMLQVTVLSKNSSEELLEIVSSLTKETCIKVSGIIEESNQAPRGMEMKPQKIVVLSESAQQLPIQVSEKGDVRTDLSKRLDWRSLDLRKPESQSIFRIQSAMMQAAAAYLFDKGFTQVFTPCLMGVASESGSEVFPVIYYDREAFLRQDPQLHRQLTIAGGVQHIFDIGPAWRAESSHTSKHLCEHRVIAVETSFISSEQDTMRLEEEVICAIISHLREHCAQELELLGIDLQVPSTPFPEITFPEVYDILAKRGVEVTRGEDLDREAEKELYAYVKEEFGADFYFLNKFPFEIKPFYVMREDDSEYARSVDLYFRGLELSSGGQREHRYQKLLAAIKEKGVNAKEVEWFSKFFEFGVPPHGGFAIGVERLTQSLLERSNIRECVLFPRDTDRLVP